MLDHVDFFVVFNMLQLGIFFFLSKIQCGGVERGREREPQISNQSQPPGGDCLWLCTVKKSDFYKLHIS